MKNVLTALLAATAISTAVSAVAAEPEDIIKYRKQVMKATGAHMGAAGAIVGGKVDFKKDLPKHAKALEAMLSDVPALFPKDSDFGDTGALDGVWSKRAEFEKSAKVSADAASAFAKAASAGDTKAIGAAFKQLGDSCKGCHKDFRKEQK